METDTKEETLPYEAHTTEAISVMRRKLPGYVVECFVAAGYDTLAVVGDMDISHEPGNSFQQIEDYINSVHPHNPRFTRSNMGASTFKFPPGHRQAIEAFVKEAKQLEDEKKQLHRKRASEAFSDVPKRKRSLPSRVEIPANTVNSRCWSKESS